jgi:hypothetical protein
MDVKHDRSRKVQMTASAARRQAFFGGNGVVKFSAAAARPLKRPLHGQTCRITCRRRICDPADCLNFLLPNERSSEVVCRLRQSNLLPGVICRTNRYFKSFLPYALNNYQF